MRIFIHNKWNFWIYVKLVLFVHNIMYMHACINKHIFFFSKIFVSKILKREFKYCRYFKFCKMKIYVWLLCGVPLETYWHYCCWSFPAYLEFWSSARNTIPNMSCLNLAIQARQCSVNGINFILQEQNLIWLIKFGWPRLKPARIKSKVPSGLN
jgi:hypothetical protein